MNEEQRKQAEKILEILNSHRFAGWYDTGRFDNYIRGEYPKEDPRQLTRDQILADIVKLFCL